MKKFSMEFASVANFELNDISSRFCFRSLTIWFCSRLLSSNDYGLIDAYDLYDLWYSDLNFRLLS